jgi:hypothetical protein
LTQDADVFTEVDRSLRCDRIVELRERDAAARVRRTSDKRGERFTFEGEPSNFEGERSTFEGDRGKNSRAVAR